MDQDLWEKVHNKLAPCTDDEFVNECCNLDRHFSSLIGEVLMEDGAVNSLVSMILSILLENQIILEIYVN